MELKLTTARAIAYEERTGKDILDALNNMSNAAQQGKNPKLSQIVEIFSAMGQNYTLEVFDAWEAPLVEKIKAISLAAQEYIVGKNAQPVSRSSSKGATHTVSNRKK